jgi:hypothetical protein
LIIGQHIAIAPGVVFKGNDVVLQKLDPLAFAEEGRFTLDIQQLQACFVVKNLVQVGLAR